MTDLATLLAHAADDLVPEHEPFTDKLDGVARLVRRRRRVRAAQAGAGAMVGVVAVGTAASLASTPSPVVGTASAMCGEPVHEALPGSGPFDTVATVMAGDGMSVGVVTEIANAGAESVSTDEDVQLIVSLQGSGEVVGYADATVPRIEVDGGGASDVVASATLAACGRPGFAAAGDPLPDGVYDLSALGSVTTGGGVDQPWTAFTGGIEVEGGVVTAWDPAPEESTAAFEPTCDEMIPAVEENQFWASIAGTAGSGPYLPADPELPDRGGVTLDVTIGTTSEEPIEGELGSETVTVLTDLGGRVVSWWRASERPVPEATVVPVALAAGGTQTIADRGFFHVLDSCQNDAALARGSYRLFTWVSMTVDGTPFPVLSAPLEVSIVDGELRIG